MIKEFKYHRKCYTELNNELQKNNANTSESDSNISKDFGWDKVISFIDQTILRENQAISMLTLKEMYSMDTSNDSNRPRNKYRHKLKEKLISVYGDKLMFISPSYHLAEVVINSNMIGTHGNLNNKENSINAANP